MAGIYIHIPFCRSRCIYCDFYSTTSETKAEEYVRALIREITLRADYLKANGRMPDIDTIYIGGGTPSLLDTTALERIFDYIYKVYHVKEDAEITLEANPDDLTGGKIEELTRLPVNRLSIGIQTFDDQKLRFLRRRHNGEQAVSVIKKCQDYGFNNISVDLIYGLPRQNLKEWEQDLRQATGLCPQHISAYSLIYEEDTPIWRMKQKHMIDETDEETLLGMFNILIDYLSDAGFEHYEISNFAKKGFRSRHNSSYWKGIPYLGCGPSAHSYNGESRQWNCPDLDTYINKVKACRSKEDFSGASWIQKETLSLYEHYNDCVITALRTAEGINLHALRKRFGDELTEHCLRNAQPHLQNGTLEITHKKEQAPEEGSLKLTRRGIFLSDGIMCDLIYVDN